MKSSLPTAFLLLVLTLVLPLPAMAAGNYRNFSVSVYARVYEVRQMADIGWLEPRWNELSRQVKVDKGKLGKPVGLKSYKPYNSTGEDFLHTYLGMIGIPIDLYPVTLKPHSFRVFAPIPAP